MARVEGVAFALRPFGKTAESAILANRVELRLAPGEELVRIRLVAHVPDEPVVRGIEYVVERYRKLDHPEVGGEMPPVVRHRDDDPVADFLCELLQLSNREIFELRRIFNPGKQCLSGFFSQFNS